MGQGGDGAGEPAKVLLPFLQRADELQKHDPLVAYYCRLYAMERGLKIPSKERSKTTKALLVSIMNQLEKDKRSLKFSPEDNLHVEGFALSVFNKADKQDRSGRADLNTAKTFYAASIFFEVLNQFGELQPEIEQKQKYAVWKAADIRKAISEGRTPEPGPPGGDEGFSLDEISMADIATDVSLPTGTPVISSPRLPDNGTAGYSQSSSPPFQEQHTGSGAFGGSHYPISSPTRDQSVSTPNVPEPPSYHSQPFPQEGSYPSGAYFSTNSTDRMPSDPGFSSNYPSSIGTTGSTYYPSSSFPSATDYAAAHPYHLPSATTYATDTANGFAASAPISGYTSTMAYAPSVPPTYENPIQRTSSAPPSEGVAHAYKPTPDKVAEAHKASRFAVSALAFDDVPTAVSYLRRSLELLTSPTATL